MMTDVTVTLYTTLNYSGSPFRHWLTAALRSITVCPCPVCPSAVTASKQRSPTTYLSPSNVQNPAYR